METSEQTAKSRRRRFGVLFVAGGLALAALVWGAKQPPETWVAAREWIDAGMAWVRGLGVGWYFAAFALLPAVGCPISFFALSAGPLFAPVLGLPLVLALAALCMVVSLTISYGLARYVLRPWVTRLLAFMGYTVPVVPPAGRRFFTVLVRIMPGPPYLLQSFLLGVVEVPFLLYLSISWLICTAMVALLIVFGDAVAHGKGRVALLALAGVVVFSVAIKFYRKRLALRGRMAAGSAGEDAA